jgi:sugar lactone lactonase YvrE
MSHIRQLRWMLSLALCMLLAACTTPSLPSAEPAAPTDEPEAATPSVEPSPTPVTLDETARLEHGGVSLRYPSGWHTSQQTRTLTLAPTRAALDASEPGESLVVLVASVPRETLEAQHGITATDELDELFALSRSVPEQAGYTLGTTRTITVSGRTGLSAPLEATGGAGELVVLPTDTHLVRIVGQAGPETWAEEQPLFAEMIDSLRFFDATEPPTPTPPNMAAQPVLVREGPPGFVLRLGSAEGPRGGRFVSARGLTTAPDGTLYVAESSRGVWAFEPDGTLIRTIGEDVLLDAYDVALGPDGDLFVADYGHNAIARFRPDGTLVQQWGQAGDQPDQFGLLSPQRIAIGPEGSIYALDSRVALGNSSATSSVMRFSDEGVFLERIDLPAGSAPNDIAVDRVGTIYLADTFSGSVAQVDRTGNLIARLGADFVEDGMTPGAIDIDQRGNIYVATWGNGILKLSTNGVLLATAGTSAEPGTTPAPGEFSLPNGIAAAPGEVVWVSDNDGEYSAITGLRLTSNPEAQATANAEAELSASPVPEELLLRQWASEASASSQYNESYAADGATGPPDVEGCRSSEQAWAAAAPDTRETLELSYATPVFASQVLVHQSHQPGAISQIDLLDEQGDATTVYTGTATLRSECPSVLEVQFQPTLSRIVGVRLTLDQRREANWIEIDAVELVGLR